MERKIPQFSTFCIRKQCESKSCHEHSSQDSIWDSTASSIFQDQIPDLDQRTLHSWVNVTLLIEFMGWRSQRKESVFRSILWVTPVSKGNATMLCFPGSLGVIFLLRTANTAAWARAHPVLVPHAPRRAYQPALTGAVHVPPWTSPRSLCPQSLPVEGLVLQEQDGRIVHAKAVPFYSQQPSSGEATADLHTYLTRLVSCYFCT